MKTQLTKRVSPEIQEIMIVGDQMSASENGSLVGTNGIEFYLNIENVASNWDMIQQSEQE